MSRKVSPRQQILNRFDAGFSSPQASSTKLNKSRIKQTTAKKKFKKAKKKKISNSNAETAIAIAQAERSALIDTLDWLEGVVIGYNLCPFAEAPMLRSELGIEVVVGTDQTEILAAVLAECLRLRKSDARGTALVVCPDLCPNNFLAFLEVYNILVEGVLPDQELDETIQIAPFHPLFLFGNNDDDWEGGDNNDEDDAIDNYTNRSPHPIFHVLREAEVEKAVDALDGNAEKVWQRNVDLLQAMEDLFLQQHQEVQEHVSSEGHKINENDNNDDDDKAFRDDQHSALLRSFFLKGKAHRISGDDASSDISDDVVQIVEPPLANETLLGVEGCPITQRIDTTIAMSASATKAASASIEKYQDQIRLLLKEFRKKTY